MRRSAVTQLPYQQRNTPKPTHYTHIAAQTSDTAHSVVMNKSTCTMLFTPMRWCLGPRLFVCLLLDNVSAPERSTSPQMVIHKVIKISTHELFRYAQHTTDRMQNQSIVSDDSRPLSVCQSVKTSLVLHDS